MSKIFFWPAMRFELCIPALNDWNEIWKRSNIPKLEYPFVIFGQSLFSFSCFVQYLQSREGLFSISFLLNWARAIKLFFSLNENYLCSNKFFRSLSITSKTDGQSNLIFLLLFKLWVVLFLSWIGFETKHNSERQLNKYALLKR